jgi:hypothetical protein
LFAGVNDVDNPFSAGEEALQFTFEEINSRLCRLLPQKTWTDPKVTRLPFYKKIKDNKPSDILAE